MTDIVERLRVFATQRYDDQLVTEAADEIERLRRRCKTLENTAKINLAAYKISKRQNDPPVVLSEMDIARLCGGGRKP
jgi:hypothetical protein